MLRIHQVRVPLCHTETDILHNTAKILKTAPNKIQNITIVKKSIDARKKPKISVVYTVDAKVDAQDKVLLRCKSNQVQEVSDKKYRFSVTGKIKICKRPVVIGTGPAGLFCGYMLAKHGFRPILLERGKKAEERRRDVEAFWATGVLKPDSNVQFGEGGAGTFSDGKLNTLIKDKSGRSREVLRIFAEAGAPEEILYDAKPHIGTDILIKVVANLRRRIIEFGGEVRYTSKVTDLMIKDGKIDGVIVNGQERLAADTVILAVGHSARDTFEMLYEKQIQMEAKAFAVGLRIEHPRRMIDELQYGTADNRLLPAADYKVTAATSSGRGVYSFCMCPGGYVVNASSEDSKTAVNGMSYSGRDGGNSNSAMIVTVTPSDYGSDHPLAGIAFQRRLESRAYEIGQGAVPVETYGEYKKAVTGREPAKSVIREKYEGFVPAVKGSYLMAPVHDIMPEELNQALVEGIDLIGQTMPGFADSGAYLSGIESRTSSPVRIPRDETGQASLKGLYPCGEGAGYAGGIMSAAMDGMTVAEKIASVFCP